MPLELKKIISTVDESPFYLCFVHVYGILINITYGGKNPSWVTGCWMGFTPTLQSMVKKKFVYMQ